MSAPIQLNAIFHINGTFDKHNTSFLLDTGAAASIIRWDSLPRGVSRGGERVLEHPPYG